MVFIHQIAAKKRALAWYLRRIAEECGISKSSAHRMCSNDFGNGSVTRTPSDKKRERPRNVSERKIHLLIRTLKSFRRNNVHITVRSLVDESGLGFQGASRRKYSRYLNGLGYYYFSARRKGILSDNDKKVRLQVARNMKQQLIRNPDFWKNEISFYLDGVSFVHKSNPKSGAASNRARAWQKREEGLQVTAKGCKDLASGRRLHVIVAIAYGKGVILKVPYEKLAGDFLQHLFENISTLLLQSLVQTQMIDVYLLWTTNHHRPVGLRNSPLIGDIEGTFMKSHLDHLISIPYPSHREYFPSC